MQNVKCKMQNAKCKMQNAKFLLRKKKKGTKTDPKVIAKMRQSQPWNSI